MKQAVRQRHIFQKRRRAIFGRPYRYGGHYDRRRDYYEYEFETVQFLQPPVGRGGSLAILVAAAIVVPPVIIGCIYYLSQ